MNKLEFLENIKKNWYNPDIAKYSTEHIPEITQTVKLNNDLNISPYLKTTEDIIHYYLVLNSINHQFWKHDDTGSFIRYSFKNKVGALALEDGMYNLINDYKGMSNIPEITSEIFNKYFGEMPIPNTRIVILNEALSEKGKECAKQLAEKIESGWTIMEAFDISQMIPSGYKDEALKKAQLILHMASSALKTKGIQVDVELTCFADYQVPRVLRHMGILKYNEQLSELIDTQTVIKADSIEEKAIRAATILACEELSVKMRMSPEELDYYLWSQRNMADKPFHLTYTTAY